VRGELKENPNEQMKKKYAAEEFDFNKHQLDNGDVKKEEDVKND